MSIDGYSLSVDLCSNMEYSFVADICNAAGELMTSQKYFSKYVSVL